MKYSLEFTTHALKDISEIKKSSPKSFSKVESLVIELAEHPTTGTGRREALKHDLTGYGSRRIDKKTGWSIRLETRKY
ncbi:type II toxin-antitoxin system YoeB family toxin [Dyadobacter sp. 32]|uniref:type II toxin-antitoxin system YoeB family toxin n=1 Tax=Dyadobacter sp. 32 TaxID=538966 RepID=UPI0039C5BDC1